MKYLYRIKTKIGVLIALSLLVTMAGCGSGGGAGTNSTGGISITGQGAGAAQLKWDLAPGMSLTDYSKFKVYYRPSSSSIYTGVDVGTNTTYTISGLSGGTYYFAVTGFDNNSLESEPSNEVSATL